MRKFVALWCFVLVVLQAKAQAPYPQDPVSVLTAVDLWRQLGVNIPPNDSGNANEYAAARAMGAKMVRTECGWKNTEIQSAPPRNVSQGYALTPACVAVYGDAAKDGLTVDTTTGFDPPWHVSAYVMPTQPVKAGDTSVSLTLLSGINGYGWKDVKTGSQGTTAVSVAKLNDGGLMGFEPVSELPPFARNKIEYGDLLQSLKVIDSTHAVVTLSAAATADVQPMQVQVRCTVPAGGTMLTCPGHTFTPDMVRQIQVTLPGGGRGGAPLLATIAAVSSDSTAKISGGGVFRAVDGSVTLTRVWALTDALYPSPHSFSADDPSAKAFANYVAFLAQQAVGTYHLQHPPFEILNEIGGGQNVHWYDPNSNYDHVYGGVYNPATTYNKGYTVTEGGTCYLSLAANNRSHDPASSRSFWTSDTGSNSFCGPYTVSGLASGIMGAVQNLAGTAAWPQGAEVWSEFTWNKGMGTSLLPPDNAMNSRAFPSGVDLADPLKNVTGEIFHAYGNIPEQKGGSYACLHGAATGAVPNVMMCHLAGTTGAENIVAVYANRLRYELAHPHADWQVPVTETGFASTDEGQGHRVANFVMRQYVNLVSVGAGPVLIEGLGSWTGCPQGRDLNTRELPPNTYALMSWTACNGGSVYAPFPSYTALQGLMQDLTPIAHAPVEPYSQGAVPQITKIDAGAMYPIQVYQVVGAKAGAQHNTVYTIFGQRSYPAYFEASASGTTLTVTRTIPNPVPPGNGQGNMRGTAPMQAGQCLWAGASNLHTCITGVGSGKGGAGTYTLNHPVNFGDRSDLSSYWITDPSPNPVPVTWALPRGARMVSAVNLTTRKPAPCTQSGDTVTCATGDDLLAFKVER